MLDDEWRQLTTPIAFNHFALQRQMEEFYSAISNFAAMIKIAFAAASWLLLNFSVWLFVESKKDRKLLLNDIFESQQWMHVCHSLDLRIFGNLNSVLKKFDWKFRHLFDIRNDCERKWLSCWSVEVICCLSWPGGASTTEYSALAK